MNYALQGVARDFEPRRGEPLKRPRPETGRSSISTRATDARSRIIPAWLTRRWMDDLPPQGSRQSADKGVSPLASGASRGIALFISR